jgi:hypothetical protein
MLFHWIRSLDYLIIYIKIIMIVLFNSLIFLSLTKICNIYCYSNFNLLWIVYLHLSKDKNLIPFVVSNHVATINSWYSSWIMDSTIPLRLIIKYNWYSLQFVIGDLLLHILPTIYLMDLLSNTHLEFDKSISHVRYSGLYSLLIHLFWGLSLADPFNISGLYLELTPIITNTIWLILTSSHILSMCFFCYYII